MYRAFNLEGGTWARPYQANAVLHEGWTETGRQLQQAHSQEARVSLQACLMDKIISGRKLSESWFPKIKADVFISHSHKDEEEALKLAGMLKSFFGLISFVDSCVWGHADELLRMIDDEFCKFPSGDSYDYNKRNGSTSHVHMMLSTALSKMLDATECVFFLNTPNSIRPVESIFKTESPWLFFELGTLGIIRPKPPTRSMMESFGSKRAELKIEYDVDLDDLAPLTGNIFGKWAAAQVNGEFRSVHPLDLLYKVASEV